MLHLAGQLLRESLLGLKESNRSQQEQRNQLRVTYEKDRAPTCCRRSNGTASRSSSRNCCKAHDSRRFDAVQWLRESFCRPRQHDDAMLRAMFAAFVDFVGRLDPRDLATRFERSARRKTMGNWELYGEFYRSLCETPPGTLPHIFVETFAQSYDQVAREGEARLGALQRRRLIFRSLSKPAAAARISGHRDSLCRSFNGRKPARCRPRGRSP